MAARKRRSVWFVRNDHSWNAARADSSEVYQSATEHTSPITTDASTTESSWGFCLQSYFMIDRLQCNLVQLVSTVSGDYIRPDWPFQGFEPPAIGLCIGSPC